MVFCPHGTKITTLAEENPAKLMMMQIRKLRVTPSEELSNFINNAFDSWEEGKKKASEPNERTCWGVSIN